MAKKLKPLRRVTKKARRAVNAAVVDKAVDSVINKYISPEEIIAQVVKLPNVKIDREAGTFGANNELWMIPEGY